MSAEEHGEPAAGAGAEAEAAAAAPGVAAAPAAPTRCRGLRWKGMFIDSPPDPTIPNPRDGFFWCRHTLTCLGPDGKVAEETACLPGRKCYEGL
jgi:hypothetical protein